MRVRNGRFYEANSASLCVCVDAGISTNYEIKNGAEVLRIGTTHAMLMLNGAIIKPGYRSRFASGCEFP